MKEEYLIAIDPAGYGITGVIIFSLKTNSIFKNFHFSSQNWQEAIDNLKSAIDGFLKEFWIKNHESFFPKYIILEDYELWGHKLLTQPTSTAKAVGGFLTLIIYHYQWPTPVLQKSVCKQKILGEKQRFLNQHEFDAWKHIQFFLDKQRKNR